MKPLTIVISIAAFVAWTAARASELSPQDTRFKATGRVTLVGGDPKRTCALTMKGYVNAHGRGVIRSFAMSGKAEECAASPTGLPWTVKGAGKNKAIIYGFGFQDPVVPCSNRDIEIDVSDTGQWSSFGQCIGGVLATTPAITSVRRHPR